MHNRLGFLFFICISASLILFSISCSPTSINSMTISTGIRRRHTSSETKSVISQFKKSDTTSQESYTWTWKYVSRALLVIFIIYIMVFILLCISPWAQSQLIFLHWICPPEIFFPLSNLIPHRLASNGRLIHVEHLHGWHILPPGPPFATSSNSQVFDHRLSASNQRIILFLHGNAGTRAFPSKRVTMIKLLSANFHAHVFTFDYSGFGDTPGKPSEDILNTDTLKFYTWITNHIHTSSEIIIYGQSLGTFPAIGLCTYLSQQDDNDNISNSEIIQIPTSLILDAPPASLIDASLTHPSTIMFRYIPGIKRLFRIVLHERFNSEEKIGKIHLPILILHGEKDGMVSIENGKKLYRAAKTAGNNHVKFVSFPNSGHTDVNGQPVYLEVIYSFLQSYLKNHIVEDKI